MEKHLLTAKKLLALIKDNSVSDGERAAAEKCVNRICEKYNINRQDLELNDTIEYYPFHVAMRYQLLFLQVVSSIVGNTKFFTHKNEPGTIYVKVTKLDSIEIEMQFDHYLQQYSAQYKKLLKEQNRAKKNLFSAFVHVNDLYPETVENAETKSKKKKMDKEQILEILRMAENMNATPYRKRLKH